MVNVCYNKKMKKITALFLIMLFFIAFYGQSEASTVCPNLTRTLGRGAVGTEVADLQGFLAGLQGIYSEALITGFFGPLTEKALQRFQEKYNIVSFGSPASNGFGLLGPRTRAMINTVCSEDQVEGVVEVKPTPVSQVPPQPASQPPAAPKPGFYAPTAPYFDPNEVPVSGVTPQMDLKINDSDGPVKVTVGSDITLSWILSNHKWWYCGKLRDWSGSMTSPASGSEVIRGINYNKVFKLNCYVDNTAFEDEVSVEVVATPPQAGGLIPTPAIAALPLKAGVPYEGPYGRIDCATSLWPGNVFYLEDGPPTVRWQVSSSPTKDWHFYWHETIDGVETKIYGGTTSSEAANNVSKLEYYNHKSLKVRRYADVVIDQKHSAYALYSTLPNTICTTNEVEFEIKESRTASVFYANFASLFNAIFPYFNIAGY